MTLKKIQKISSKVQFFAERMKMHSTLDGFMLYGKLGINFLTTTELLYPNMRIRIRLLRARPNFYIISENPNVSLGFVDCFLYTRRVILKQDYHKKKMSQLAYAPVEYNYVETLAKICIIPVRQNQFVPEKNSTTHQYVEEPLQRIQTLPLLVPLQRTHSGINSLI